MNGIVFEDARPAAGVDPGRADIACFAGLVRTAGIAIPGDVRAWLAARGVLRYPFVPSSPVAPLPAFVRAWFLAQGWIESLASNAAQAAATPIGTLVAGVDATATTLVLAQPAPGDPPLFVRAGAEIVAVADVDPARTTLTVARGTGGTRPGALGAGTPLLAADVAPFAQLAAQLMRFVPPAVADWLRTQGWLTGRYARDLDAMLDVPVPVESAAGFSAMFDPSGSTDGTDYLANAVRAFFAQGGKRCYVVRMGDPIASTDAPSARDAALAALLPSSDHDAGNPASWHGAGHLAGLTDVAFVVLPDLPLLVSSPPLAAPGIEPSPAPGPVAFAECTQGDISQPQSRTVDAALPRCTSADYVRWGDTLATLLAFLAGGATSRQPHLREMQLVAAVPVPRASAAGGEGEDALAQSVHAALDASLPETLEPFGAVLAHNASSAFLQLAYPWVRTSTSGALRGGFAPPDGVLSGMLARNALTRGTFASATKVVPSDVADLWPPLPAHDTSRGAAPRWDGTPKPLVERVSTFGFTPDGVRLLSDVTAYPGEAYRDASVNRLVSVICRAARRFGDAIVFGTNGPALWGRTRAFLQSLLAQLWTLGAFAGPSVSDAFAVRCDASTMTQNDLDNGVLVATVTFAAAGKVDRIVVTLALEAGAAPVGATA